MGQKSGGSSQRPVTEEEKRLWDSQAANLDSLTKIAEEQYNLSAEDRDYYEKVFREGTDTQAKEALAKLQSQITGKEVSAADIQSVNIDSLLRDTILNATPEFQKAAADLVSNSQQLTSKYGTDVTGLSNTFSKGIQDLTTNYNSELQSIKEQTGTINQDVLSRETGAQLAGISQAYAEARKQMSSDLARRGIGDSGVAASTLANTYQQEALAKASAMTNARGSALQQSEAIRQQQANIAGAQYQVGAAGLQTGYQAGLGAVQNVYGVTSAADYQNYQTLQAAQLQGIAGLTQVAQAGTGVYAGSQNYLAGAGNTSGNAAQIAGSNAIGLANANTAYQSAVMQQSTAERGQTMELVGTLAGAGIGLIPPSDVRLKTNLHYVETINGYDIYTWDWIDGYDGGYNKGVIAQQVQAIKPEAVIVGEDGYMRVDYSQLGLEYLVKGE